MSPADLAQECRPSPKSATRGGSLPAPAEADVAILNLKPAFDPGRGSLFHQGRLYYTEKELGRVLGLMRQKPTVVTVFLERPLVIPEIAQAARAVVANFGATDGAIFDVLFGRSPPEGRLPFEMPSSWEAMLNQQEDVPFDSENPLFRFGHGLRYQ